MLFVDITKYFANDCDEGAYTKTKYAISYSLQYYISCLNYSSLLTEWDIGMCLVWRS